uniref:Uncharacterized protein n=1 Tax=Arundo donax TaxID=35708 RepID=A0A0A9CKB6_ARUDO
MKYCAVCRVALRFGRNHSLILRAIRWWFLGRKVRSLCCLSSVSDSNFNLDGIVPISSTFS